MKDREGAELEKGAYGFCKASGESEFAPSSYKGVGGKSTAGKEGPTGLLADIAVQFGADYVERSVSLSLSLSLPCPAPVAWTCGCHRNRWRASPRKRNPKPSWPISSRGHRLKRATHRCHVQANDVKISVTPDKCRVTLDVVFVLDGSNSINSADWEARICALSARGSRSGPLDWRRDQDTH